MIQIRRIGLGWMRPSAQQGETPKRVGSGLLLALAGLLSGGNALAQSVEFQQSLYNGFVGTPVPVTIETRNMANALVDGGTLTWDIDSCSSGPVFQPAPPPAAPTAGGVTTANLLFSAPDMCSISVTWDPDGPGTQPPVSTSLNPSLLIDPVPLVATPQTPLSQTLTPFASPVFRIRVTDAGVPQAGMYVEWVISRPNETFRVEGGLCSSTPFDTDANGFSELDFSALSEPLNRTGTWVVEAFAVRPGEFPCQPKQAGINGSGRTKGSPPTNLVQFGVTVEDVNVAFQSPPTTLVAGSTGNLFQVLVTGAISGNPVSGVTVNFSASGPLSPANASDNTDGSGLAEYLGDAGQPDLMGAFLNASVQVPLQTPVFRNDSVSLTVVDYDLSISTPAPASPTFSEESAAGFSVLARADSGNTLDPQPGVPITFTITSGNGTFSGGATSAIENTNSDGIAFSPVVVMGRTAGPVVVEANGGVYGTLTQNYAVQPSTYLLAADGTPISQDILSNQTAPLAVRLQRQGSSTPVALGPGEQITWSISPNDGSTVTPSPSSTDNGGLTNATFDPAGTGSYTVTALFNTGFTTNPQVQFTVNVDPASRTLSAVSGDLQTGAPGQTYALPLVVEARDDTLTAPNIPISVSISPSTAAIALPEVGNTDSSGQFSTQIQLDPSATVGVPVIVTLTRADDFSATATFTLSVQPGLREIIAISGNGQSGQPGTTLAAPLVIEARDDGLPVSGSLIEWSASGGATVFTSSNPSPSSLISDVTQTNGRSQVQVNLPPGSPGTFQITATRINVTKGQVTPQPSVTFTVTSMPANTFTLIQVEGDGQQGIVGQPGAPLAAQLLLNGEPASSGIVVNWSVQQGSAAVSPTSSMTDANGIARTNLSFGSAPGESLIRALSVGGAEAQFRVFAAEGGRLQIISGDGQSGPAGRPLDQDFVVEARAPAGGVLDSAQITWSVTSGGGSLSETSTLTDRNGRASTRYTPGSGAGVQEITASLATGASVTFRVTTDAAGRALIITRGNLQRGLVFASPNEALEVQLLGETGSGLPGTAILWEVDGDASLAASSVATDADGKASNVLTFGATAGMVMVRARAPGVTDPVVFTLTSSLPAVATVGGNGQSGTVNQPLANELTIDLALPASKSLTGVPVQWQVLTGGGTLSSATTLSNAQGRVSNSWTLGGLTGEQTVQASLPGGQLVIFRATAEGEVGVVGTLRVVSGSPQTLPTSAPSAPLIVELVDAQGRPINGVLIEWSGDVQRVSLRDASNRTGSDGRANNVATVLIPGAVSVTARVADSDIPSVSFLLTGGVAQIPGLDDRERDIGGAIDNACPALAALPNRTPEQEDLFRRCSELVANAGDRPDEVRNALGELPTDVGTTLSGQGTESVATQFDNLDLRLHMIRGEKVGGQRSQFNLGVWTPDGTLPLGLLPSAFMANATDEGEAGMDFDRWGFFATGQIGRGKVKAGERSPKFDFDIAGLTFGVDYRFSDRVVAGVALGYSDNDAELANDRGTVDTKGWNLSGYATWYSDRSWYLDGTLMYGRLDYDLQRRLRYSITALDGSRTTVDQVASASTDGDTLGASFSLGRDWQKGPWSLNGYLRGQYSRVETDAFVESMLSNLPGQGLALAVDSRSTKSMTSVVGGRATYILSRDWGILMPNFTLEWEHEFEDDPSRLRARLAFDPTRSVIEQFGDSTDTDYFNVGMGVSALFPGGRSAYLYYEELVGASRLRQGLLSLGVRFEF